MREVGHLGAVGGGGEELLRLQPRRLVEGGQRLEGLARGGRGGGGEREGGRLREAVGGDPDIVALVRVGARRGDDLVKVRVRVRVTPEAETTWLGLGLGLG